MSNWLCPRCAEALPICSLETNSPLELRPVGQSVLSRSEAQTAPKPLFVQSEELSPHQGSEGSFAAMAPPGSPPTHPPG